MVDLKKIPPYKLYEALKETDDGKSFLELLGAEKELQKALVDARVKAGNAILNFINDYYLEQQAFYREEFGKLYLEAMEQDKVWIIEDDNFNKLLKDFYDLTVG